MGWSWSVHIYSQIEWFWVLIVADTLLQVIRKIMNYYISLNYLSEHQYLFQCNKPPYKIFESPPLLATHLSFLKIFQPNLWYHFREWSMPLMAWGVDAMKVLLFNISQTDQIIETSCRDGAWTRTTLARACSYKPKLQP